jgi:HD-like signal output (HDOD) protein/signal transduction histidine kinase
LLRVPAAILDSIESLHLPPIPQILLQFLHLADDESTTISELAVLVGQDPSLSARILTVANSPAIWRGVESKSLTQCLVNLGTRLSRTLAACLIVQNFFSPSVDQRLYDFTGFWGHSLRLAETARAIATEINYGDTEEAYLAGLLHDIGQLLLLGGVGKQYGTLLAASCDESTLHDLEKQNLGTDHTVIGAWLVDQWRLSSFMADAILFHHKPAEEIMTADTLSQIIWSAHVLCEPPASPDSPEPDITEEITSVKTIVGIDVPDLLVLRKQCADRIVQIADALGFRETPDLKTFPTTNAPQDSDQPDPRNGATASSPADDIVRDMALMQSLQQDLLTLGSEEELLVEVREAARILFGIGHVALLLVQPDKAVLSGANVHGQPTMLQRLEIQLDPPQSLAATTALGKMPHSTFSQKFPSPSSLADVQITRILGCEGLLYVPLRSPKQTIGVLAFGISAEKYARILKQLSWITSFGQLAAVSVETWREMRIRDQRLESAVTKRYELQARRVIHEAKNPLSIIKNYLNIVKKKLPETGGVMQELDILKEEIDRVATILRQMSSPAELQPACGSLDINSLIESMFALYGDSLFTNRGIATETYLDPNLTAIDCDRDSVKQILVNLWNNASDVMGAGDCFFISTHADINQNGRLYIEIRLSDTGPGMPHDVMQRLFKPLDPNRRPGHSGVGLSIVSGLVERLDGRITCQSTAGRGTSFSILLPHSRRDTT